ncbi:unnamed protein product, partial [Didymodactylos carnosus]
MQRTQEVDNSPLDYANIDLNIFENFSSWSDEYLIQINVKKRPYQFQIELVQMAIKQENTIICLRTGAGKTYIAALLIKYYYMKKMKIAANQRFLTIFLVPHRSICEQQVKAVDIIGNLCVTGCNDESFVHEYIQTSNVIVCTPQKLLNCLNDQTISLKDIDVLVFDECHNC